MLYHNNSRFALTFSLGLSEFCSGGTVDLFSLSWNLRFRALVDWVENPRSLIHVTSWPAVAEVHKFRRKSRAMTSPRRPFRPVYTEHSVAAILAERRPLPSAANVSPPGVERRQCDLFRATDTFQPRRPLFGNSASYSLDDLGSDSIAESNGNSVHRQVRSRLLPTALAEKVMHLVTSVYPSVCCLFTI